VLDQASIRPGVRRADPILGRAFWTIDAGTKALDFHERFAQGKQGKSEMMLCSATHYAFPRWWTMGLFTKELMTSDRIDVNK
jgi:hypothetical protein